jgi:multidrug efflux pump subunit AcrB
MLIELDYVVDDMRSSLPEEIVIEEIYDESSYTTKKFNELIKSFSLAIFFVLSISLFFLGFKACNYCYFNSSFFSMPSNDWM